MPKFVIMDNNNIVLNFIIADTLEEAQTAGSAVEYEPKTQYVSIGWIYNPETNTFTASTLEEPNA